MGFIDLTSDSDQDPHQMVLFTPSPFGPELLGRDLIQTESGNWIDAAQHLLPKEVLAEIKGPKSVIPRTFEKGEPSKYQATAHRQEYRIELPEEDEQNSANEILKKLDQVTEKELILTWNDMCNLKRERGDRSGVEEVEEEMLRRKKQKKESWYDENGNLLCVTISTIFGNLLPPFL